MPVYDAFISYSHAKDKPVAAALQSVIQRLGKPWYKRRALRVFRDDTSLSATPQLWPSIEQALSQSRYLLLLSSPEAASSPWVGKEVEYWLANKSTDTLFIGVTNGMLDWDQTVGDFVWTKGTPLPEVLKGRFPAEPKWVDLTAYRDGADPRNARFIEAGADFAAAIHGTPKEDLLSQEVRQQRRALSLAVSAAALLLLLAIGAVTAGIIARTQQLRAQKNFAAAEDTVRGLIFSMAQGLRDVEGIRVESLDKILGQARKTVERLTETDPNNVILLRDKAVMLDEFAKTYLAAGNLAAALKSAEESSAILPSHPAFRECRQDAMRREMSPSASAASATSSRRKATMPGLSRLTRKRSRSTVSGPRPTRTMCRRARTWPECSSGSATRRSMPATARARWKPTRTVSPSVADLADADQRYGPPA